MEFATLLHNLVGFAGSSSIPAAIFASAASTIVMIAAVGIIIITKTCFHWLIQKETRFAGVHLSVDDGADFLDLDDLANSTD